MPPAVAPGHHHDQCAVPALAGLGQVIPKRLGRLGQILTYPSLEDAPIDQAVEPIGEDIEGDHQFGEGSVEPAHTEGRLPDHSRRPRVSDLKVARAAQGLALYEKGARIKEDGQGPGEAAIVGANLFDSAGGRYPGPDPPTVRADAVLRSRR